MKYVSARQYRWVKVQGEVISSKVEFDWEYYRPVVEYAYVYNGTEYRGDTVRSRMLLWNFKFPASGICARYPSGARIDVYIDPMDPSRSVLERGGDLSARIAVIFAALFLIAFGLIFLNGRET
jgi:hypothetical protein